MWRYGAHGCASFRPWTWTVLSVFSLLADEPTSSLDPKTSAEIMELISRRAQERDIPVMVNIHNVELARRFADRVVGMSKGEIVFDDPRGRRSMQISRRFTAARNGWRDGGRDCHRRRAKPALELRNARIDV
jgi:ABC-type multidrug transport system ATPase subunit